MSNYYNITRELNELKISHCDNDDMLTMLNKLHNQADDVNSCVYTYKEARDLIFSHHDVLDSDAVEQDTQLWCDIRDIQQAIVYLTEK